MKLLVSINRAIEMFDIGETLFREEVLPQLQMVKIGSRRLIPVSELEKWVDDHKGTSLSSAATSGASASPSTGSGTSTRRVRARAQKLKESLDHSTQKPSEESSQRNKTEHKAQVST